MEQISKPRGNQEEMLWKTQLLDLVNEAPKPRLIECQGITPNHKFTSGENSKSNNSTGSSSGSGSASPEKVTLTQALLKLSSNINNNNNIIPEEEKVEDEHDELPGIIGRKLSHSPKTAAAPWHRPSIYYFNPFGPAFHGNLSLPLVKRLLVEEGDFLLRKRVEEDFNDNNDPMTLNTMNAMMNDEDFVLSVRFNSRIKNFLIHFDDTSGLIYLDGDNNQRGFENLEDLVEQGLITMYLEHKAGPYIDLLYDLTRNSNNGESYNKNVVASLNKSGTFTVDCIYEFFDTNKGEGQGPGHQVASTPGMLRRHWGTASGYGSKQGSPSPISSVSGSSLERVRHPDLKSHSFQTQTFQELSKCLVCQNFLWGLSGQGLQCQHCDLIIHDSCLDKVTRECEPDLAKLQSIFGVDLTLLVKASSYQGGGSSRPPFLLQKCIEEIDKRGLHVEGLYRISGPREATERLRNLLEKDREMADLTSHQDIHSMCSIVKQFLRTLPEPLISDEVFKSFLLKGGGGSGNHTHSNNNNNNNGVNATVTPTPKPMTVDSVRKELKKLPPANYITLKYLLQHLHRVADRSEENKMNPFNLSSIFAPSLYNPQGISIQTLQTGTVLLELMITQVRNLFPK